MKLLFLGGASIMVWRLAGLRARKFSFHRMNIGVVGLERSWLQRVRHSHGSFMTSKNKEP
jgi:hypothetical protein